MNDIFETEADIWVIPVNCIGVMGRGLALQFAKKKPEEVKVYKDFCKKGEMFVGRPVLSIPRILPPKYVCYFPTKDHWMDSSRLAYINWGSESLSKDLKLPFFKAILGDNPSIAMPKIGCGLGGLDWKDVKPLIERHLDRFNVIYLE